MVKIVGLAGIDKSIKALSKIGDNLNARVQDTAVAIVEHANGAGNGDVSRALSLCQTVQKMRTLNVAFLAGFLFYFGNCKVDLKAGKVSLRGKDTKGYRGFDVEGARANNWFDAVDKDGNRAAWYAGPTPAEFQPATIGDMAEDFRRFVKREVDKLNGTKDVGGKVVPLVSITEADKVQLDNAFDFILKLANTIARREDAKKAVEEAAKLQADAEAEADPEVLQIIGKPAVAKAA